MTRVAAGHPAIWPDVCIDNRDAILAGLAALRGRLATLEAAIASKDRATILSELTAASAARRNLPSSTPDPTELAELRVPGPGPPRRARRGDDASRARRTSTSTTSRSRTPRRGPRACSSWCSTQTARRTLAAAPRGARAADLGRAPVRPRRPEVPDVVEVAASLRVVGERAPPGRQVRLAPRAAARRARRRAAPRSTALRRRRGRRGARSRASRALGARRRAPRRRQHRRRRRAEPAARERRASSTAATRAPRCASCAASSRPSTAPTASTATPRCDAGRWTASPSRSAPWARRSTGRGDAVHAAARRSRGGALRAIRYELPVASAQVKSAILLAGLAARRPDDGRRARRAPARTPRRCSRAPRRASRSRTAPTAGTRRCGRPRSHRSTGRCRPTPPRRRSSSSQRLLAAHGEVRVAGVDLSRRARRVPRACSVRWAATS